MGSFEDTQQYRMQVGMLLDIYGQLLPGRAREVLENYYNDDLSLAEIAELRQISRQAVHDRLHQGLNSLEQYEKKLGLLARFHQQQAAIRAALADLDDGRIESARERLSRLEQIL